MRALLLFTGAWIVGLLLEPGLAAAQGVPGQAEALARQSLRPYGHVFAAYALAWALILGWVVSLSRRWARLEEELDRDAGGE